MYKQILLVLLCAVTANAKTIALTESNTITIRGEVSYDTMQAAQFQLSDLVAKRKGNEVIYLVFDSPGGDVVAGEDFIEYAKTIPNLETVTLFAASMASAIVESLPGSRHITDTGTLMFHRMKISLSGQIAFGEFESRLAWIQRDALRLSNVNADRMQMDHEEYATKAKDEYWITGVDAVAKHGADDIVSITCSKALVDGVDNSSFNTMFGPVNVKFSKCPLFKAPLSDSKD